MTQGKLEVTIKINELPQAQAVENGWQQFEVDCDGRIISITIAGKMGEATGNGFIMDEPNIQVFEKKAKTEVA